MTSWRRRIRVTKRIGVLTLWQHQTDDSRWAVSLENQTYARFYEIQPDRRHAWMVEFVRLSGRCPQYEPDHNGECLNCDGWADAHL